MPHEHSPRRATIAERIARGEFGEKRKPFGTPSASSGDGPRNPKHYLEYRAKLTETHDPEMGADDENDHDTWGEKELHRTERELSVDHHLRRR